MRNVLRLFSLLLFLGICVGLCGAMELTRGKRSSSVIYLRDGAGSNEVSAAKELQAYLQRATGVQLPVSMEQPKGRGGRIFIREYRGADAVQGSYQVRSLDDNSVEVMGVGRGLMYGVCDLLGHLGFRMYGAGDLQHPDLSEGAVLPMPISSVWKPVLSFSNVASVLTHDAEYSKWHRLTYDHDRSRAFWGLWGASYFDLLPVDEFYGAYPEYYALRGGKRVPTQLCLSNLDVLMLVTDRLQAIIDSNPSVRYLSVSPELNGDFCECSECAMMDEVDGSSIGSVLQFADIMAQSFTNKRIGLFLDVNYLGAPSSTMASDNLVVVLSNFAGDMSQPVASCDSHAVLRSELSKWQGACSNLMVSDYLVYPSVPGLPLVNFGVLGANIRYFYENGVRGLSFDGGESRDGYMLDVKSYLASSFMTNPSMDSAEVMSAFLGDYYGAAGPVVGEFFGRLESSLLASGLSQHLYLSESDARSSWLTPALVSELNGILARAKMLVRMDSRLSARVARLEL